MADREEEDLLMAIRMSLQGSPPNAKRSKPRESPPPPEELPEQLRRRTQRELMAAAAEKRLRAAESMSSPRPPATTNKVVEPSGPGVVGRGETTGPVPMEVAGKGEDRVSEAGEELAVADAEQLFSMVFGKGVSQGILSQWSNQGIR